MAELLIARGIQPDNVYTIYNGIDFDAPSQPLSKEAFLESYGIKAEPDWVLAGIAARFDAVKDVSTLIRGFAIAAEKTPKLRLLIAGQGQEEDLLKQLALDLGVSDRSIS
jgi:glycosyltransferase involved in cell wall biosynthesis